MNKIALMQGRLSVRNEQYQHFPYGTEYGEFPVAKKMGFDAIEVIYDGELRNPLSCHHGLKDLFLVAQKSDMAIDSVCADVFMHKTLFDNSEKQRIINKHILAQLITNCAHIGIKNIVIPCIETSSLKTLTDKTNLRNSLRELLYVAEDKGINLCLETDLNPLSFYNLIQFIDHPNIRINYDTGNSAFMGFDTEEELNVYGSKISVVHIKDRKKGGPSVKLGTGDVNFELVFKKLKEMKYDGLFTLQCARPEKSTVSGESNSVRDQFTILKSMLERWYYNVS